jgi:hypothetical protein
MISYQKAAHEAVFCALRKEMSVSLTSGLDGQVRIAYLVVMEGRSVRQVSSC